MYRLTYHSGLPQKFYFFVSRSCTKSRERERDGGKRENKKKKSCVGAAPFLHRCRGIKGMTRWLFFFISTIIWHLSPFLIYRRWLILEFFYTYHFLLILFNMLIKLLMYILVFFSSTEKSTLSTYSFFFLTIEATFDSGSNVEWKTELFSICFYILKVFLKTIKIFYFFLCFKLISFWYF